MPCFGFCHNPDFSHQHWNMCFPWMQGLEYSNYPVICHHGGGPAHSAACGQTVRGQQGAGGVGRAGAAAEAHLLGRRGGGVGVPAQRAQGASQADHGDGQRVGGGEAYFCAVEPPRPVEGAQRGRHLPAVGIQLEPAGELTIERHILFNNTAETSARMASAAFFAQS